MKMFVALLRGINVGGNNILHMAELKSICEQIQFQNVHTYIQSGNVIFESALTEAKVWKKLEDALESRMDKPIAINIRSIDDLDLIISNNPFPMFNPSQVGVLFLKQRVPVDMLKSLKIPGGEQVKLSGREIYIYYPDGMGHSKLKFPKTAESGTIRNINTVSKLAELGKRIKGH